MDGNANGQPNEFRDGVRRQSGDGRYCRSVDTPDRRLKGCGRGPERARALAAVANAVLDAMYVDGIRRADMPFVPARC